MFSVFLFWLVGINRELEVAAPHCGAGKLPPRIAGRASPLWGGEINSWWFLLPFAIFIISRLLPFFRWGEFPLGADAAIYLKQWQFLPPEILYTSYLALNLLVGWGVYLAAKEYFGKEAAYFSLLIYCLSISQFLAYWLFFFRAMPALFLLLAGLILLKRGSFWTTPVVAAVALFHSPTFLPILPALVFSLLTVRKKSVIWSTIVFSLLVFAFFHWQKDFFAYFYYLQQYLTIENASSSLMFAKKVGGYFSQPELYTGFLALFYLPFAILSFVRQLTFKKFDFLFFITITSFSLIPLNFLFYNNRLIVILDLLLIILSGPVVLDFIKIISQNRTGGRLLMLLFCFLTFFTFYQSWKMEPVVNKKELEEIRALGKIKPKTPIYYTAEVYESVLDSFSGHQLTKFLEEDVLIYHGRRSNPRLQPDQGWEKISEHVWKLSTVLPIDQ